MCLPLEIKITSLPRTIRLRFALHGEQRKTVKHTLDYLISKQVDWNLYTDLETIGIDEISNRKGHQDFIAIISAKDKYGELSILAVLDSRKKDDVLRLFSPKFQDYGILLIG